jgi:plastocyanin
MFRISFIFLLIAAGAQASETRVAIDNFSFTPAEIRISPGTHVIWTNADDIPHTVTDADNPSATHSPPLDTGESYQRVFDTPGTYHYFCSLHAHMQGTIIVR